MVFLVLCLCLSAAPAARQDPPSPHRGYGVRELGRSEPVDEHTLFAIGSEWRGSTLVNFTLGAAGGRPDALEMNGGRFVRRK